MKKKKGRGFFTYDGFVFQEIDVYDGPEYQVLPYWPHYGSEIRISYNFKGHLQVNHWSGTYHWSEAERYGRAIVAAAKFAETLPSPKPGKVLSPIPKTK